MNFESEKRLLLDRDAAWSEAAAKGEDIDLVLSYWTDDAVVIPPGFPSMAGKEALRQYVEQSFQLPGFSISWKSDDVKFSPDGQMAYMFSTNKVKMTGEDGAPLVMPGRAVTVWRREADGEWRCAVDIWNAEA